MLFNSLDFVLFLPIVYLLYWKLSSSRLALQNLLLLVASYFFYACWDYRFLFLLIFSTLLDYFTGIKIASSDSNLQRKKWLWVSIGINAGFLGFFKYYNFFAASFADFLSGFGLKVEMSTLNIVLPVGISFYTFHGLSYVIDIYRKKIKPEINFIDYSLFVSFFPLLVAGPIERATHLLPQLKKPRNFDYARSVDGLRQMAWGFFKKVVVADSCSVYANQIFDHPNLFGGSTLLAGALFFTFQIYCDFSGYSDIALGTARLFGIELLRNFNYPYFSRDIAEFWRRWHISLSSWFRDYVYIPLGGSKGNTWFKIRNTFVIFLLSGFWHGANWTFVFWGALNAFYFLPVLLTGNNRNHLGIVAENRMLPTIKETLSILLTFTLTLFAWIFFRSPHLSDAFAYVGSIFSPSLLHPPEVWPLHVLALIAFLMIVEWMGRRNSFPLENLQIHFPAPVRWSIYMALLTLIFLFYGNNQTFIYFQF